MPENETAESEPLASTSLRLPAQHIDLLHQIARTRAAVTGARVTVATLVRGLIQRFLAENPTEAAAAAAILGRGNP